MGGKNIDFNPLNSSLFSGQGLPWGPMQTGDPGDMPNAPRERSMDEFQAFDQSEMVKRLIAGLRNQGSREELGAMRQASRMGAGQSDAARAALGDIRSSVADRTAGIGLQAAKDSWADRMAQKQFAEQQDLNRYQLAAQNWAAKKGAYEMEQQKRKFALNPLNWIK